MRYLAFLVLIFSGFSLSAQQPAAERRHYRPSRSFLENADENCFEAARREADRAFSQRCWDDASLLYRAAKNCANADQKRRQEMSDRLEACREAAELELINRERHAIAANRADDSRELLLRAERSLAYRMADFANSYIAPPGEDNPDCQQAMFDAWYASPGAIGADQNDSIQAPFCYQLGENMGEPLTVRFVGNGNQKKIYAFSASRHLLFNWDANTLEQGDPSPVDPNVTGFEVAPDGHTFLLYSDKLLIFWRKGRELYRLNVPRMHDFCFDERGDEFFLLDTIEKKIEVLGLKDVYLGVNNNKVQKQRKLEEVRIPPTFRPWVNGVGPGVLDFAVHEGDIWLGYTDSLVVLHKSGTGKGWQIVKNIPLQLPKTNYVAATVFLRLFPEKNEVFYGSDTSTTLLQLPAAGSAQQSLPVVLAGFPIAATASAADVATLQSDFTRNAGKIQIYSATGGLEYVSAVPELEYYQFMTGMLDPDGEWLVIPSSAGVLHCWKLKNNGQNVFYNFSSGAQSVTDISPNGHCYTSYGENTLSICNGRNPGEVLNKLNVIAEGAADVFRDKLSDHWVATPLRGDSMLVWNWEQNKQWVLPMPALLQFPVAFSSDEQYLAAAYEDGQVRVYDLSTGRMAAMRLYSGEIRQISFVPGTNELVLLQGSTSTYDFTQKTILRIIHPFKNDYKQRTVRLHEYNLMSVAVSDQGKYLAVTDGLDIRIFEVANLTDEIAQILPTGEGEVQGTQASVLAIQFTPDGRSLVATYGDRSVVSWNIETGMANFRLELPAETNNMFFSGIRMVPEGNLLCLLAPRQGILIRTLDPAAIRAAIQPPNYQLISFTPDQIRKYSLDQALNYEGNFERLASSGDIPLINSFFNYYFQQAGASSNIERVSQYCDRASVLYSQLDTATQRELRPTMLVMYNNYLWKWLIRDRPDKAEQVLQYVNRQFGKPFSAVLSEAHIALVKGGPEDLRKAVRLYGDWIIRMSEMQDFYMDQSQHVIFDNFIQLAEFELIGEKQIDCLCGMFGDWDNFTLCNNRTKNAAAVPFDPEMRLRWEIYKKIYRSGRTDRFAEKLGMMESAREDARQLSKLKAALGRTQMENVVRQEAEFYLGWAKFEQNGHLAPVLCKQGIQLLEEIGPFHQQDQKRLETLAYLYLDLANVLFARDDLDGSLDACQKGYAVSEKLWAATADTFMLRQYADGLVGNQLTLLGNVYLMLGEFSVARTAFDEANNILSLGLNSYFTAHVDLMEGKEYDALISYGGIFTTDQLGSALFDMQRLADRFPGKRDSILAFMPRMRTAWLANHLRSSALEVDYRFASLQTQHAANLRQYDRALEWNTQTLQYIDQLIQNKNVAYSWGDLWADATLNQSFYMLFNAKNDSSMLTKAIQTAEAAEQKVLRQEEGLNVYGGSADYFKTNMAHAYLLRNRPGDREKAINTYRQFLSLDVSQTGSYWDVLQKDFRDLHAAGIEWPDLKGVATEIKPPYVTLTEGEWREIEAGSER